MPAQTSARRRQSKRVQGVLSSLRLLERLARVTTVAAQGSRVSPDFEASPNHERTAYDHEHPTGEQERATDAMCKQENHARTTDDTWCNRINHPPLTSEGLRQWEMHAHVDHVYDLVPFWQCAQDAAERGEVLRLEEFLQNMEGDGGWRTVSDVLQMMGGWKVGLPERTVGHGEATWNDWGAPGWGEPSNRVASDVTESSRKKESGWGTRENWVGGGLDSKMNQGGVGMVDRRAWVKSKVIRATHNTNTARDELRRLVDTIAQQEAVNEERRRRMHIFSEMPIEQKVEKIEETIRYLRTHGVKQ